MSSQKDDPASRLKALERMGVVKDYSKIYNATIIIVGVGGVGAVVAEMLTRCGVGKLILFDYDDVELANMNRLFYTPNQAAKQTLNAINPQVHVETINGNICKDYTIFYERICTGGISGTQVDLVLSCVDNYAARVTINKACCQANQIWMNSGVAENATSGQIQTCIPGITGCFLCAPPYIVAVKGDESTIKRPDVCTASLPTTMGVVAGLLAHNALKHILQFGTTTKLLTYNSLQDYFPTYSIGCNPECTERYCLQRQEEKRHEREALEAESANAAEAEENTTVQHDYNEYNITIVSENELEKGENNTTTKHTPLPAEKLSLKELREKLKNVSTSVDLSYKVRQSLEKVQKQSAELLQLLNRHYDQVDVVNVAFQWAESPHEIFLALKFSNRWSSPVSNESLEVNGNMLKYSSMGTQSDKLKKYQLVLELHDEVVKNETKVSPVSMGRFTITLKKAKPAVWNSLTKGNEKLPNQQIWWDMKDKHQDACDNFIEDEPENDTEL
ncbi:Ubiquitin-like modifier-activating enzyme 5 [Babesia sp. Xinjiang]|uniref:Ubiquitin-like modifier-activating enzyme 5 n=1 Tax=Babesia sp. Xinjiang TaxID=462227 RepID=UPI000A26040C|nr:Ubiquitin-like modifier-activating enzyme 5 [Babesia sp. Xinjiang]ORM41889.1 Ubiquitin-like modifier-activating enzyme 5 [Babesia sp. Xinjiang]